MKKISVFQIIIIALFVIFIIAGVAAFALYKGGSANASLPAITVWGTFPADTFNQFVTKVNSTLPNGIVVHYVEEDPRTFTQDLTNAVVRGTAPDAILITPDMILSQEDKLTLIPYSALAERTFLDSYIQEADVYLNASGILALPFTVDPLVMYWNRDTFSAAGVAKPPTTWDQVAALVPKFTVKDGNGNIRKSAVAMGTFANVDNARELLGSLFLQVGNPVTAATNAGLTSTVSVEASADPTPAIQYFSQFVDPSAAAYSWNRSLPDSKSAFLSGNLAMYFGYASELADIRAKNPNLNFDVAPLPQLKSGGIKAAYGRMYGFSLVRTSPNINAAFEIISTLTEPQYLSMLSQTMYLPPVRTDLIAAGSSDPYITIFDQEALVARSWLDADPGESANILGSLIDSVTSGAKTTEQAIGDAGAEYNAALKQAMQ